MGRGARPVKAKVEARSTHARKSREVASATGLQFKQRLSEALEQHAAVSEILRVISRSQTDVQPVFDTIAASALALCQAEFANVFTYDGEQIHLAAFVNVHADYIDTLRKLYPRPPGRGTAVARAIETSAVCVIPDVLADPDYESAAASSVRGWRSILAVPLLRGGKAIGGIAVGRPVPGTFPESQVALLQTFADQAVIAIENVRLFKETAEALERQTATSEILRVISQSPTDVHPVFDTIAAAALKLCRASSATLFTFDGELIRLATFANVNPEAADAVRLTFPRPPGRDTAVGRAVLTGRIVAIPDVLEDTEYAVKDSSVAAGFRSLLSVPLIRDKGPIGAISVGKPEPGLFPDEQVALLQIFADQAVIAIENVRLFDEVQVRTHDLTESLQQQTATADVLKVISRSTFDLQTVLDTLTESACKLCEADASDILRPDGDVFRVAAMFGQSPAHKAALKQLVIRPGRDTCVGRTLLEGRTVHIRDAALDPEYNVPDVLNVAGNRAMLGVPLLREGAPIGVLVLTRSVARPFTEKQIALATTFADQAVIAIENVRLFNETTEALEQQTATSEILRVISQSPTDVQPVFDTIVSAAMKLCSASSASVFTFDGELIHLAAVVTLTPEGTEATRRLWPRRPGRDFAAARAILTCNSAAIPDVLEDPDYPVSVAVVAGGFRSILAVPLVRNGNPIGAIAVGRPEPGPFPDEQVVLLETFADQAVIAIENVRLFKELEARNRDLTETLEHQTATSEILRVISSSPTDVQPVFDIISERAGKLCDAEISMVTRFDGGQIYLAAIHGVTEEARETIRRLHPMPLSIETVTARAIRGRGVVHISDVMDDPGYGRKDAATVAGWRGCLAVPMLREGQVIGAIFVARRNPGLFADSKIELLKTFADQAVIAIENVRLFNETKEALEQQTATSEILRVISSSPTRLEPVLEAVVSAAARFCGAPNVVILRVDGGVLRGGTGVGQFAEIIKQRAGSFSALEIPITRESVAGRAVFDRRTVHVHDLASENEDEYPIGRQLQGRFGHHTTLATPLLREGVPLGVILLFRMEVNPFSEKQIELLRTFADQAVIAIENVRLFTELEARTGELTRSVSELKALGEVGQAVSSTLDLETVLSTIVSRAAQLAGMDGGSIWEYDETREEFYLHATDRLPDELVDALRAAPIRKGEGALGRLAMTGEPVQIRDLAEEPNYPSRLREVVMRGGYRSVLAVPLLREDHLLGALTVNRNSAGEFAPEVIALLKTFATQSALAIQNARLFREVEVKSRELETASRHKSEFLANMSHELRTPLNAIIGFSEVLSEQMFGEINEKQAEYIGDILESGQHLLSLINDILDLSKIEAGRMELEPGDFDLPSTIESTLILVRERAVRRGIELRRTVDEHLGMIRADERKVKQVLLNLLSNALKFTPEGGQIDVRAAVRDGAAEISVTDTGVGIAPEDQEAVFEEFRQVGMVSKKVEGTGLGLAISRKFIELHGGKIWVKSQVGAGSTFAFTLPLQ